MIGDGGRASEQGAIMRPYRDTKGNGFVGSVGRG